MVPLTNNPNAPNKYGDSPIHMAENNGNIGIVKILAPLTDNPNAADEDGKTPIYYAACLGNTEILIIFASYFIM